MLYSRLLLYPFLLLFFFSYAEGERGFRIAFGSCVFHTDTKIFESILQAEPDLVLLLGDNIYIEPQDQAGEARIRDRYKRLLAAPGFQELLQKSEVHAIWDDHDFGLNDADAGSSFQSISRPAFHWFRSRLSDGASKTRMELMKAPFGRDETIAYAVKNDRVTVVLTDNRSFRRTAQGLSAEKRQVFSRKQLDWIKGILERPPTPLVFLASGGALLPKRNEEESLWQSPHEWEELLESLQDSPASVFVLSGDTHFSGVYNYSFPDKSVSEIFASPLSAATDKEEPFEKDSSWGFHYIDGSSFGMVTLAPGGSEVEIEFRSASGEELHREKRALPRKEDNTKGK